MAVTIGRLYVVWVKWWEIQKAMYLNCAAPSYYFLDILQKENITFLFFFVFFFVFWTRTGYSSFGTSKNMENVPCVLKFAQKAVGDPFNANTSEWIKFFFSPFLKGGPCLAEFISMSFWLWPCIGTPKGNMTSFPLNMKRRNPGEYLTNSNFTGMDTNKLVCVSMQAR